ncbi:MAG: hypothetical protein ACRDPR_01205, partial [Nocardioidaceae bacterium]
MRQAIEQARSMPMSASVVVNRAELLELLDELQSEVDTALSGSDDVVRERDDVIAEGRREADQIVADARHERDRLVSDTE